MCEMTRSTRRHDHKGCLNQPPRLLTSRLLKVVHYWVHQTLNRFSTPNYTEKTLTPVPNSREGCLNWFKRIKHGTERHRTGPDRIGGLG